MEEWKRIIWTDEASMEVGRDSRARRVWRTNDEEFHHSCIKPTFKSGRSSVMIWGAIVHDRLGPLFVFLEGRIKSAVYVDDILKGPFIDFTHQFRMNGDIQSSWNTVRPSLTRLGRSNGSLKITLTDCHGVQIRQI